MSLNNKVHLFLLKIINFGWTCHFIPYNHNGEKFTFDTHPHHWFRLICQLIVLIFYEIFLVTRCLQTVYNSQVTLFWKVRVIYMTITRLLLNASHIISVQFYGRHHLFITNFIQISHNFQRSHGEHDKTRKDTRTLNCMKFSCLITTFAVVTDALAPIISPESPTHFTSLASQPKKLMTWIKILAAGTHFYINSFHHYFLVLYYGTISYYLASIIPLLRRLRLLSGHRVQELSSFYNKDLTPLIFSQHYSCLYMLQEEANTIFCMWTAAVQTMTISAIVLNFFQFVVLSSPRGLILAIAFTVCVFYYLIDLGELYEVSKNVLHSWKIGKIQSKWFTKYHKARQPIRFKVGTFFFADYFLILTVMHIVVTNAVNMIVTYRS